MPADIARFRATEVSVKNLYFTEGSSSKALTAMSIPNHADGATRVEDQHFPLSPAEVHQRIGAHCHV